MNRKQKSCPVSSTPHPGRICNAFSLFDDAELSPIVERPQAKLPPELSKPVSRPKPVKPARVEKETGVIKKRRVAPETKVVPDSASSAVLKELGVKQGDLCNNALSQSRNLYNMFPEPIVLDSDEEELLTKSIIIKKKQGKRAKQENHVPEAVPGSKKNEEEGSKNNSVPVSKRVRSVRRVLSKEQQQIAPAKSYKSVVKDKPLTNFTNIQPSEKNSGTRSKNKDQHKVITRSQENSSSVMILENDDLLPEYHGGRKNNRKKYALLDDLDEKDTVGWTPRKMRNLENEPDEDLIGESSAKSGDVGVEPNKRTRQNKVNTCEKMLLNEAPTVTKSHTDEIVANEKTSNSKLEEFPPDCIARFERVSFKVNKTCGGVVAKCLHTGTNDFGYVEIPAGEIFNGLRSDTTFVLLEGKAKVIYLGVTQTLSPGDMLHINTDSGYQFECVEGDHVRFLYVKVRC